MKSAIHKIVIQSVLYWDCFLFDPAEASFKGDFNGIGAIAMVDSETTMNSMGKGITWIHQERIK